PVTFATGVFARRTIRVQLEEIQKADLGRKYARKDKRPLDPPPVVICRFFNLVDRPSGPPLEIEIDPEQILGAICHVDLFPIPEDSVIPPMSHLRENAYPLPPLETLPSLYASLGNAGYLSHAPVPPMASLQVGPQPAGSTQPPALPGVHNMMSNHAYPPAARHAAELALDVHGDEVVAWFGAFPIYENSKCTTMLSGATFMQSAVIDYEGKKTAMFVFSDLAVKIEGTFVLRYRAFTLFSECAHEPRMPILAECFGGPFKIYSTKEFPGLLASTELTKRLAMHGVRVNLRENPRRRRK
ncbi:velvet factor, partial [Cubamyces menziesii]